jgi:hypothetical protein
MYPAEPAGRGGDGGTGGVDSVVVGATGAVSFVAAVDDVGSAGGFMFADGVAAGREVGTGCAPTDVGVADMMGVETTVGAAGCVPGLVAGIGIDGPSAEGVEGSCDSVGLAGGSGGFGIPVATAAMEGHASGTTSLGGG